MIALSLLSLPIDSLKESCSSPRSVRSLFRNAVTRTSNCFQQYYKSGRSSPVRSTALFTDYIRGARATTARRQHKRVPTVRNDSSARLRSRHIFSSSPFPLAASFVAAYRPGAETESAPSPAFARGASRDAHPVKLSQFLKPESQLFTLCLFHSAL